MKKSILSVSLLMTAFFGVFSINAQIKPAKKPAVTNEQKMLPFGLGLSLAVLREHSLKDFENAVREFPSGVPAFAADLKPVIALKANTPTNQRRAIVEKAQESLRNKMNKSDVWQFNAGTSFGNIFSQIESAGNDDITPNAETLLAEINIIRQLAAAAPDDIPKDILADIKAVGKFYQDKDIASIEGLQRLFNGMLKTITTISPD